MDDKITSPVGGTDVVIPAGLCLHHFLEQQAARTPQALALVHGPLALTYAELEARADRLAQHLRGLGVGPDVLVGLCVERSLEMGIGLVAILKAGGAYVPLDPAYPQERLQLLLRDIRAPVLLTQRALAWRLRLEGGAEEAPAPHLVCLDEELPAPELEVAAPVEVRPEQLAYVIYTSGSTGRPKGIELPHRALVNLIRWHDRTLLRAARTLQFASLSFDASCHELFAAWASGGTVFLIDEAIRRDPAALVRFLAAHTIEKVILPVVVLQQIAELCADDPEPLRALREVTTTGEQLHITQPVVQLFKRLGGCTLHNHYGPSETHVVTALTLPADPEVWPARPSIGRPIDNTQLHILEPSGAPVAPGEIGELFIGGASLARGYLGRPDLTAQRFVPDPFSTHAEARLYRTGDLARWLPDGTVEFLGRIDHQVKIRGHRVELGEIEAALTQHPAVHEAVVVAREDLPGGRQLVAYVVARGDTIAPTAAPGTLTAALRLSLRERLPGYMLPSAIVRLEALPLTHNGKVDRRALPAPGSARPDLGVPYTPPRTPTEAALCELFGEALGLDRVGVHDSFFELGGDSLRAVRIFARVKQRFGLELGFARLFTSPSVAGCAALLDSLRPDGAESPVPSVTAAVRAVPGAERPPQLPLSPQQERLWFLHRLAPQSPAYNCAYAFRLHGLHGQPHESMDPHALRRALLTLTRRHEILRTTFPAHRGCAHQRVHQDLDAEWSELDLSALSSTDREAALQRVLDEEARRPFDLDRGPLVRAGLVRLAPAEHALWLNLHHLITDGRSMAVLLQELTALYGAYRGAGPETAEAEPPALQYADYALWQQQPTQRAARSAASAYWRQRLSGAQTVLALPTDFPRPAAQSFRGDTVPLTLDAELTRALRALGAQHQVTLVMGVLAGFTALLHRVSGQDDLLVGIPSLGRDQVETESLLGFFVSSLPLRIDLGRDPSFTALLQAVRRESLAAFEHDQLPFDRLVHELQIERHKSHSPLLQVALAPQPPGDRELRLVGQSSERIPLKGHRAVFDLTLFVWEEADGLAAELEYATDLFRRETIEALAAQLQTLLAAAVQEPSRPVSQLALMTELAQRQLLRAHSGAEGAPEVICLPDLLAERAAQHPDALAVLDASGRTLSYAELDRQASRVARALLDLGVGPGRQVALCADRSLDGIAATLGILRAGASYLPLDPRYPTERLAFMLRDAAPAVILTQRALLGRLPAHSARCVLLDGEASPFAHYSGAALPCCATPDEVAYTIYTSGSTGQPKGVLVEHRSLSFLTQAQCAAFGLRADDRVLQFSSLSFDASISELSTTLAAGATLCLLPPGPTPLGLDLARFLSALRISVVTLPPSVLADLATGSAIELLGSVRTLIAAGEACSADLVARFARGRRFLNAYGPTECTVCATLGDCGAGEATVTIGRPLAGARVYLLDRHRVPVPVGVPGEIYIGGAGVARGYLDRAALTAERFLADPFSREPAARMYRTGDLGRFLPDGRIEFLGRVDRQLKLHGFRIEPGEIEAALREHPLVRDAAVIAREDVPGDKRLIAYVVPAAAPAPRAPIELWPSIAEHFVYDDLLYFALSSDERRNHAYRAAFARAVRDKIVVEIGTGAEAILARLAIEAGARKVYAIELLAESFHKARARIEASGLSDRIVVLHGDAASIELPEPAEVCISEIVGAIGGSEGAAYLQNRARRLLREGARVIPERCVTRVAAITLPESFMADPAFTPLSAHYVRKIFEQVGRPFDLRLCLRGVRYDDLLSDIGTFEELDFRGPVPLEDTHEVTLTVRRAGRLSGLLVWLNLYTLDEICIDILQHEHCWIPVFLPIVGQGVEVAAGARIRFRIIRVLSENGRNPDYHLAGAILHPAGHPDGAQTPFEYTAYHAGHAYRQGPFYERLFAQGTLPERAPDSAMSAGSDQAPDRVNEHLSTWVRAHEELLRGAPAAAGGKEGFYGWNSSYSGLPIPLAEMQAWRADTVERIAALAPAGRPPRVWEIGCGTGLILLDLAPRCAGYLGTDISAGALALLAPELQRYGISGVRLEARRADDTAGIQPGSVDAVLLNSVVQYFPNLDYLRAVLRGATAALSAPGVLFIGDVRSLPLLPALRAEIELQGAADSLPIDELRRRTTHALRTERELVLDPAAFQILADELPVGAHAEIWLKRGRYENELSRFRYDVVLHVGSEQPPVVVDVTAPLARIGRGLIDIKRWLMAEQPQAAELLGVPNPRVHGALQLAGWIQHESTGTVGQLRARLRAVTDRDDPRWIHPEDLIALGARLGYSVRVTFSQSGGDGAMDALFERRSASAPLRPWVRAAAQRRVEILASEPLQSAGSVPPAPQPAAADSLPVRLRAFLDARLPAHLVPSAYVELEALPQSPNGKLDRGALPAPEAASRGRTTAYVAPQGRIEQALAGIWTELLGVERVGARDDFFALGGHSLLVSRVIFRIRDTLGIDLPMRALYEAPVLADLARVAQALQSGQEPGGLIQVPSLRMEQEAWMDPALVVQAPPSRPMQDAASILLTGATGYVGAFLLAELLQSTDAQVHCLVRARSPQEGWRRLRDALTRYGLWEDRHAHRIQVVLGDLGSRRLGLDPGGFAVLGERIDAIYHCGARVDHVRGYHQLKAVNVDGTREILALATSGPVKPVHFLSTLGVIFPPEYAHRGVVTEADPAGPLERLPNGYQQTKCVAEQLVQQAITRGVPATIYRLGAITGHSETGVCNPADFTYSMLRTVLHFGMTDDLNTDMTLTPVDYVVRALVTLSRDAGAVGQVFHLTHPIPTFWFDVVQALRERGHDITMTTYSACVEHIVQEARAGREAPLAPFLPLLTQRRPDSTRYLMEEYYAAAILYGSVRTQALLQRHGILAPPSGTQLLEVYLSYLAERQLLPAVA